MKGKYILFLICSLFFGEVSAQTLEQARTMFTKGDYENAKPVFKKYVTSQPSNGNYNFWYGVCCLKTGEAEEAVKPLEMAVKKRVSGGQLYLGQAYNDTYRFEDAVNCFEEYIADLKKRKRATEEAELLLEKSKADLRMLKGVEEVCIIDSFVVNKATFLDAYKISEESGKLFTFNDFFQTEGDNSGTVYETEIGNKIYYSEKSEKGSLDIFSKNKLLNEWSSGRPLPGSINDSGNANYPFVMADGVTIYYASDGEGLGGYDIFVTRYNTNTDTYLVPENVGMPFNSPYNDYMYVVDEYNNLGWFASDRFQPEDTVCIYVFIPNSSKQTYNYESMEKEQIIRLAQIHSLKESWKDQQMVNEALQRLKAAITHKPQERRAMDFEFIIDDNTTYYFLSDFKSAKAKQLFQQYQQMEKDFVQQEEKLNNLRQQYANANNQGKEKMAPAILDLEKRILQMSGELDVLGINVRNAEKTK
ncbi:hypothetical protein [uncultured Bacteroides sp.]|uniref:hypothetical protein n=1 Tax=uncultured Bacteroides sp. TaxID=162156 RepID=UPI0025FC87EA|nr:hypothetical protein [uncultured Bacteroides sp.]